MSQELENNIILPLAIDLNLNPEGEGRAKFCFTEQDLKIYADEEQLRCDLGRSESRLLLLLISKPDKVFNKSELIDFAWAGRVVSDGSLTHAIFNLRSFFWRCGKDVFVTAPRAGYYFNSKYLPTAPTSPHTQGGSAVANGSLVQSEEVLTLSAHTNFSKRRRIASIGLTALVLLAISYFWLFNSDSAVFLIDDPISLDSTTVGGTTIHVVEGEHFNTSLKAQHDYLTKQINTLSLSGGGEVWLSYTKTRYRVACFTDKGATTYAAPLTVSLEEVLSKCLSN
jgi:DNA-binding winged helix-turn-helix (wHTH) protein